MSFKETSGGEIYQSETEDDTGSSSENESENEWDDRATHYPQDHRFMSSRDGISLSSHNLIPITTTGSVSWTLNSTQDSTIHLEFDCSEDIECYLEELSRLRRLGRFNEARQYFESCRNLCGDHPDFVIDFVETLLSQGAMKDVLDLVTDKHSPALPKDCDQIYHHALHSALCVTKFITFGWHDDAILEWTHARSDMILKLEKDFVKLSSLQVECNILLDYSIKYPLTKARYDFSAI